MRELGVDSKAAALAATLANSSRATKTWKMDDSVKAAIDKAAKDWGTNLDFPWNEAKLINFITHLASRAYIDSISKGQNMFCQNTSM